MSAAQVIVARTLDGDTTIATKLRRSSIPCDEIQKVEKAGADGLLPPQLPGRFRRSRECSTREFKVDEKDATTLTTYSGPGDVKTENLSGPDAIPALREKALLADAGKSATPAGRDHALEQLAYLHIAAGNYNKVLALAPHKSPAAISLTPFVLSSSVPIKNWMAHSR